MEEIPWGFKSPLSHRFLTLVCAPVMCVALACAPSAEEAALDLKARLETAGGGTVKAIEDVLVPETRVLLREIEYQKWLPEVLEPLRALLGRARPVPDEPGLLRGGEPWESLFFVRDGHGMRLDAALSGAWFAPLRSLQYPRPW